MSDEHDPRQPSRSDAEPKSWRGRHPSEDGDPGAPTAVPEDDDIVPNRHSASAEAALLRWHETHDED